MIRSWKAAACLALGLAAAPATAPAQDAKAPAGEWVSLFDGKTLSGWTAVPLNKQPSHWEVKDGVIEGSGSQSMLYSPSGNYKNFVFRAEVKINDKGNSGMYVRCPAMKPSFTDGYEIQVNSTHTDPVVGNVTAAQKPSRVLLPAPLGPSSAQCSPLRTLSDMPSMICLPLRRKVTSSILRTSVT